MMSLNPGYKEEYERAYKNKQGYEDIIKNNLQK